MIKVRWSESSGEQESLAVCLRALLAGQGVERSYDELVATLGLGAAIVAVENECLGWWWTHARDLALPATADLYGLGLRELHPSEAAAGLEQSREFPEHFHDSYVPLIQRALAHGQLALAWRGWPEPAERCWGIVTAARGEELYGYALGCGDAPWPLRGAALQVYVVESFDRKKVRACSPDELFAHATRAALTMWHDEPARVPGVQTGAEAWQAWRAALAEPHACRHCGDRSARCQSQMTQAIISTRRTLAGWLRRVVSEFKPEVREQATARAAASRVGTAHHPPWREQAAAWAAACEHTSNLLGQIESEEAVRPLLASAAGRAELLRAIDDAFTIETEIYRLLARGPVATEAGPWNRG